MTKYITQIKNPLDVNDPYIIKDPNASDEKVKQSQSNNPNWTFPILASSTTTPISGNAYEAVYSDKIKIQPVYGIISLVETPSNLYSDINPGGISVTQTDTSDLWGSYIDSNEVKIQKYNNYVLESKASITKDNIVLSNGTDNYSSEITRSNIKVSNGTNIYTEITNNSISTTGTTTTADLAITNLGTTTPKMLVVGTSGTVSSQTIPINTDIYQKIDSANEKGKEKEWYSFLISGIKFSGDWDVPLENGYGNPYTGLVTDTRGLDKNVHAVWVHIDASDRTPVILSSPNLALTNIQSGTPVTDGYLALDSHNNVIKTSVSTSSDTNYYHSTGWWNGLTYIATKNGGIGCPALKIELPTGTAGTQVAFGNHEHGNISNTGTISATGTIASGDKLIISQSGTITASSISFGTSTTTFLRNDGTWGTPDNTNYYHTPTFNTGLNVGTGVGVSDLYIPNASTTQVGVTKVGTSGGAANYSHTHGNISNTGTISATGTIASGDKLIISQSGTITASSITFGTSTTTFLRNDGTWGGDYLIPQNPTAFVSTSLTISMADEKKYYNFYDNGGSNKTVNIENINTNYLGHIVYFRIANQTANLVTYTISGTNLKGGGTISIKSNKMREFSCIVTYNNWTAGAWGILTYTNEITI